MEEYIGQCCIWYFEKLGYSSPLRFAAKQSVMNRVILLYIYRAIG
jgi:hypothetical protein